MRKYPLNPVEYYSTFRDLIEKLPEGRESLPGISWYTRKGEEAVVNLGQLREDVRCLQAYFVSRGLNGKRIAILGENCYEWLLVYFAAAYCGATAVCVDVEQSDGAIREMLEMADVSAIVFAPSLEELCSSLSFAEGDQYFLTGKGNENRASVAGLIEKG